MDALKSAKYTGHRGTKQNDRVAHAAVRWDCTWPMRARNPWVDEGARRRQAHCAAETSAAYDAPSNVVGARCSAGTRRGVFVRNRGRGSSGEQLDTAQHVGEAAIVAHDAEFIVEVGDVELARIR